jgi:sulfite reductase (ferredoxin)
MPEVAAPTAVPEVAAPTPVEGVKEESRHLRGTLFDELAEPGTPFTTPATHLLKFHGIYQQDDRDARRELARTKQELAYSCMVRTSVPGGSLTADEYLALDRAAGALGGGMLRVTTRQGIQFHFIAKTRLHDLVHALNESLITTLGACGDVVRNVTCCPAPTADRRQQHLLETARAIAQRFRPQTNAYFELWVDGEKAVTAELPFPVDPTEEPLYGDTYLPRKFKIGIAWPGDNCIDVYTQDIGVVPVNDADGNPGYTLLVGGGLGMGHADPRTYPRLATPLGWVPIDELGDVAEAVVAVQRDFGDRTDRKFARLKYTIDRKGEAWFRAAVEGQLGRVIAPAVDVAPWLGTDDHLGWHAQPDGRWFLGVHVDSGRVRDVENGSRLRSALRTIVYRYDTGVQLTALQDVLLTDVRSEDRAAIETILREHEVTLSDDLAPLRRHALACPALPTCGLALGEAERVLPTVLAGLDAELEAAGLGGQSLHVRMTGCPNGCARPYTAELGIVGRTKTRYDIWVGGAVDGSRLAEVLVTDVPLTEVPSVLRPLFDRWKLEHLDAETFGDWSARVGVPVLASSVRRPTRTRATAKAKPETEADIAS